MRRMQVLGNSIQHHVSDRDFGPIVVGKPILRGPIWRDIRCEQADPAIGNLGRLTGAMG
jgi:hypothetical protein